MSIRQEMQQKGLSIVMGSYNRCSLLKKTVASLQDELAGAPFPHEIIVVDGGSSDGSLRYLLSRKDIITIVQHNRGRWKSKEVARRSWGYFMNLAFKSAQGRYVCMISDDCLFIKGSIRNGYAEFREIEKYRNLGQLAFWWREWPLEPFYKVSMVFNSVISINHGIYLRKALEDINFIDEDHFFFYHADSDLTLRMVEKGYETAVAGNSYVEHLAHSSPKIRKTNLARQREDFQAFMSRWAAKYGSPEGFDMFHSVFCWKTEEYEDVSHTICKYWPRLYMKYRVRKFFGKQ